MAADRNENGYEITSSNYFREISRDLKEHIEPATRQALCAARANLGWEAFEFLLGEANLEKAGLPTHMRFKGHVTRAVDGTSFFTPRTEELLMYFSPRNTRAEEEETHYPYGLLVAAVNVFTGQPVAGVVTDYKASERDGLRTLITKFSEGDLTLLDRGLGGIEIYLDFLDHKQFFVHRIKTSGDTLPDYVRAFLDSGKRDALVELTIWDRLAKQERKTFIRLIRGPKDNEGKPIAFATNLLDKQMYSRADLLALYRKRWGAETLYDRVKNLLQLEKFHARSYNGIMQEIFANFVVLALAAMLSAAVIDQQKLDPKIEVPSFKNATEVVRAHLSAIVDHRIRGLTPKKLVEAMLREVARIKHRKQPGRSYPRVSRQPIQSWNLKKSAKIRNFEEQKSALC